MKSGSPVIWQGCLSLYFRRRRGRMSVAGRGWGRMGHDRMGHDRMGHGRMGHDRMGNKIRRIRKICCKLFLGYNKIVICSPDCCLRQAGTAPNRSEMEDFDECKQQISDFLMSLLPQTLIRFTKIKTKSNNWCSEWEYEKWD